MAVPLPAGAGNCCLWLSMILITGFIYPTVAGLSIPPSFSLTCRSVRLMGVNSFPYDSRLIAELPQSVPKITESGLKLRFSKWAPFNCRNVARTLGRRCNKDTNTRVFLHASVTAIDLHTDGHHVEGVQVRTLAVLVSVSRHGKLWLLLAQSKPIACCLLKTTCIVRELVTIVISWVVISMTTFQ